MSKELITLEELRGVVETNRSIVATVREIIGPTTMKEVYGRVGVSYASLRAAMVKGSQSKPSPGGRPRQSAKMSGQAALEIVSRNYKGDVSRTSKELADALRAAADLVERRG